MNYELWIVNMKQEKNFEIRSYGKSELAMMYFPNLSSNGALRKLKKWFEINKKLRFLLDVPGKDYMPKHVKKIVEEVGGPYEYSDE